MSGAGATPADSADPAWLSRIEDAGINASAPREQLWIDGWLVRFSPGKAKRARCIQPVAPGRLGIDEKLALCLPLYAVAGLRPYVRITPFAEPAGLDRHLASLGMASLDDTRVMLLDSLARFAGRDGDAPDLRWEAAEPTAFADWIGAARGSTLAERSAHADRISRPAVPHHAVLVRDEDGMTVAGGQVAIEGRVAGLFDIFTVADARGRGYAERVCRQLLGLAAARGADAGYLQVDAGNDPARRIYRRLGFSDAYSYHYRTPAEPGT